MTEESFWQGKIFPIIILLLVSAGIVTVILFMSNSQNKDTGQSITQENIDYNNEWSKGADDPSVVMVEYSDFECPACASHAQIVSDLVKKYPNELLVVYRHYPLNSIHQYAQKAAEAAEAAGVQGKFWEMHDLLFTNQTDLTEENLKKLASQLGLDISRFIREMNDNTYRQNVLDDYQNGRDTMVNATPTFFINGKMFDGSRTLQGFSSAIDAAIANTKTSE